MRPSLGFLCTLGGIAMTLLAWFGPWAWPGWPASAAIDVIDHFADFADLAHTTKAAAVVMLIVINVGAWALAFFATVRGARGIRRSKALRHE